MTVSDKNVTEISESLQNYKSHIDELQEYMTNLKVDLFLFKESVTNDINKIYINGHKCNKNNENDSLQTAELSGQVQCISSPVKSVRDIVQDFDNMVECGKINAPCCTVTSVIQVDNMVKCDGVGQVSGVEVTHDTIDDAQRN